MRTGGIPKKIALFIKASKPFATHNPWANKIRRAEAGELIVSPTMPTDAESEAAPPLVIAHGLFGSGRNWGVIARRLADIRDVWAVDMRNHGESPRASEGRAGRGESKSQGPHKGCRQAGRKGQACQGRCQTGQKARQEEVARACRQGAELSAPKLRFTNARED